MVGTEGILYGFAACVCFALAPVFYERGSRDLPPSLANLVRLAAPLVVFTGYVLLSPTAAGLSSLTFPLVAIMLGVGGLHFGAADTLLIKGIQVIGPARAATISSVYPIFVLLFLREPVSARIIAGIALVTAGVYLVSTARSSEGVEDEVGPWYGRGVFIPLGTAAGWGIGIAIFKTLVMSVPPELLNLGQLTGAFLCLAVMNAATGRLRGLGSRLDRSSVVYMSAGGFFGTALGSLFMYKGLALERGSVISSITAASPILTALITLSLGERVTARLFAGVIVTVAGIVLVVG
ncbi:MAG: DMT family transporter [Methanopyri archaeon]|jgi:drug/metabolite transporter (DMT)-like permease|nr:DMT family transporter [Methanopyri archaeon]